MIHKCSGKLYHYFTMVGKQLKIELNLSEDTDDTSGTIKVIVVDENGLEEQVALKG